MNRSIFFATLSASLLAFATPTPAPAQVDPASLAEQDLAAESRGDVAAALALYSDDAIVQYGGLCWSPYVGKAAIRKELERRVAAKNQFEIVGKYVSGKSWWFRPSYGLAISRNPAWTESLYGIL